jgi:uncharacterized protein YndB with AHSA1/START domain
MTATTARPADPAERELRISRILDAPRALVFKAWTQPEHLARWWGPHGFTLPSCQLELRQGGRFACDMRSPEGTLHRVRGVYREIIPPERLVFTWAWLDESGSPGHETLVTVTFEEEGARTRLTLHQAIFESVTARDSHHHGWSESLERLAAHVAAR